MIENPHAIAAVIGHPIAHSRSPVIHNTWLKQQGIEGDYDAIDITPKDLKTFCALVGKSHLKGFNITLPHKEEILQYCDEIDTAATKIGAVNTVRVHSNGRLSAYNTDAYGFLENLRQEIPDFDISASPAMVLGAGGAARAVLYALENAEVPYIILANRSKERADALAKEFKRIEVIEWEQRENIRPDVSLLINTTSLGMNGQNNLDINLASLANDAVVYDLVYNPLQTDFLKQAAARGNPTLGGLGMLVYQAEKAFEIWFDKKPNVSKDLMQVLKGGL